MGRLVKTHSTYIEGLIEILKKLANDKQIKTITPGVISNVRSISTKLTLRISRDIKSGYKITARKGRSVQEVYIITKYKKSELEKLSKDIIEEIKSAADFALKSKFPSSEELYTDVYI